MLSGLNTALLLVGWLPLKLMFQSVQLKLICIRTNEISAVDKHFCEAKLFWGPEIIELNELKLSGINKPKTGL